jgi:hypothetical protein
MENIADGIYKLCAISSEILERIKYAESPEIRDKNWTQILRSPISKSERKLCAVGVYKRNANFADKENRK